MRLTLWLFAVGQLSACSRSQSVETELRAWRAVAPPSYEFDFKWKCFCPGAGVWWRVVVENHVVTGANVIDSTLIPKGGFGPPAGGFPTIDSVFARIERAIAANSASVDVFYDADLHFPISVTVDQLREAVDDEWTLDIRSFRPRRGPG